MDVTTSNVSAAAMVAPPAFSVGTAVGALGRVGAMKEQRAFDGGVTLPFIVECANPSADVPAVARWVEQEQGALESLLTQHGAVLFRGFPLRGAEDFDAFVCAFKGWDDLSYERSMSFAVRKRRANRICTTNEGKSGGLVFHHEQAQTPLWPSKVCFCCETPAPPGTGGATGLTPSHVVLSQLREAHPEFVAKCESVGVRYTVFAGPAQDTSKGAGRSWRSFFHVETREECEARMAAGGWEWQWGVGPGGAKLSDDCLRCVTPRLDAIKAAPGTDRLCFFNQLIATTANALEFTKVGEDGGGFDPLHDVPTQEAIDECVRFADGSSVDLQVLLDAKRLCEENAVDLQWQVRAPAPVGRGGGARCGAPVAVPARARSLTCVPAQRTRAAPDPPGTGWRRRAHLQLPDDARAALVGRLSWRPGDAGFAGCREGLHERRRATRCVMIIEQGRRTAVGGAASSPRCADPADRASAMRVGGARSSEPLARDIVRARRVAAVNDKLRPVPSGPASATRHRLDNYWAAAGNAVPPRTRGYRRHGRRSE